MSLPLFLYSFLISLYKLSIVIAANFKPKARFFINGRKGLLQRIRQSITQEKRKIIWVHCASLGEFEQGRPVIEQLKTTCPSCCIFLTFFSPSGYEVRKNYKGADYIFYLPLDTYGNAAQFLDIVKPELCIFIKYEFWFGYLNEINKRQIKAILVSAIFRKDQAFFSWYGAFQRSMLKSFSLFFVQNEESKKLLKHIGINEVILSGDTRFDRVIEIAEQRKQLPIIEAFTKGRTILVAGSTWRSDEVFLNELLQLLPDDIALIVVPHEVHEDHIEALLKLFGSKTQRYTEYKITADCRVLIVDTIGLLSSIYAYGHYAWIGGAFDKGGVHNVLEAAVYGIPCAYGPIYNRYAEAVDLIAYGGACSFTDAKTYASWINSLPIGSDAYNKLCLKNTAFVKQNAGATHTIIDTLQSKGYLPQA
jgi:3-deoxy-D-manno-octulosonic-acid transferase